MFDNFQNGSLLEDGWVAPLNLLGWKSHSFNLLSARISMPNQSRSTPSDCRQFVIVLLVTIGLTSLASHFTKHWVGLRFVSMVPYDYGSPVAPTRAFVASSSLGYYGLDWQDVAQKQDWRIRRYDIPAASPCEFEMSQDLVANVTQSVLVVSIFDLDETYFSEHRAAIVPLGRTLHDLKHSGATWAFCKRTLALYPEHLLQTIFPTIGASTGVLVGWREKFQSLVHRRNGPGPDPESEKAVLNGKDSGFPTARITDWDKGRLLGNTAALIASTQRTHFFNGPKYEALNRVVAKGLSHGDVFVVVMPVTAEYRHLVIDEKIQNGFDACLATLSQTYPSAKFIRLDRRPALADSSYFWDLVHLNTYGREIATRELETALQEATAVK